MDIVFAAIADHALIDVQQKMSVIGIFDTFHAPAFPATLVRVFVCLRISLRPIEYDRQHTVRLILQDEDGQRIGPQIEGVFAVASAGQRRDVPMATSQLVVAAQQIQFQRAGHYSFEIALDGQHIRSVPIYVLAAQQPPQPPAG